MSDFGTRYADRAGRVLEIRFQRLFTEAQSDILKKLDDFTAKYQKKDKQMRKKLEAGEIDQEKYDRWVAGQVFQGAQWEQKVKDIDDTLLDYYSEAMDMTYGKQLNVFSKNANYQAYCMEHEVGKNFGFDLYDVDTVERLVQETPELLPRKIVNKKKHNHWNQGIINNCITQGIIQGESIKKISSRIANTVANLNDKSATMYARTAMTSAQNGGRMEMLKEAKGKGINVKKQWLAIVDGRTRDSHIHLDGQIRDVDKPFKSDYGRIDFPGDFKANPADVYNCRCTLVYVFPEYEDMSQYPDWEEAKKMTYPEWEQENIPHQSLYEQKLQEYDDRIEMLRDERIDAMNADRRDRIKIDNLRDEIIEAKEEKQRFKDAYRFADYDVEKAEKLMTKDPTEKAHAVYDIAKEKEPKLEDTAWNGKVKVVKSKKYAGSAGWDGTLNINEINTNEIAPYLHEDLHFSSITAHPRGKTLYTARIDVKNFEEGTVELYTQEIMREAGISYKGTYEPLVTSLKTIHNAVAPDMNDFEFARTMYRMDVEERVSWLSEKVDEFAMTNNIRYDQPNSVIDALGVLKTYVKK